MHFGGGHGSGVPAAAARLARLIAVENVVSSLKNFLKKMAGGVRGLISRVADALIF